MTLSGVYSPSAAHWVRDQVEAYERSGGKEANTLRDTGLPVIIVTMRGNKSGNIRKIALMRVEHDGEYVLVASKGGAPQHPVWYYNLKANPDEMRGQEVFFGKGQCATCHTPPYYTDNLMHNLQLERFYKPVMINGMLLSSDGPIKTFPLRGIKDSPPFSA